LYWRFTGGLYYEGVPEFANEFGDGFQNYVGEVLERACPDPVQRLSEQEYAVGTAKKRSVDWIIASSHWRPTSLRKGPLVALNVSAVTARFPAVRIAENICSLRSFLSLTEGVEKVGDERGRSPCESFLTVTFRLVR
jgi:hypothetical protein